ncbi:16S rRNA (cytidine(1402)-2'-O)-methyltransferase [Patescibacteria group bacterium]|nr:16S rRNA (cytidine(1402)-2'-O)-methyltransferase [Patescibacteria group bacterium]
MAKINPGALFLVATPIGNLEDLSPRAKRTLSESEIVLAEDTRKTGQMLKALKTDRVGKLVSYYQENELARIPEVVSWLKQGENVSLVSNAGTPLISDPGYRLVQEAIRQGFKIVPIPGPSALLTALIASGLPCDRFIFLGFLPKRVGRKKKVFSELAGMKQLNTVVFYESPNRLSITLVIIKELFGNVPVVVGREMTKLYEQFVRGDLDQVALTLKKDRAIRGEVTVVFRFNPPS